MNNPCFANFKNTSNTVSGTGSGACPIYSYNNVEYVMKKNNVLEFYGGSLFQLILGKRSANVLLIEDGEEFYAGSQREPSYQEVWTYNQEHKDILNTDLEGLALIVVASFLLGENDLKGLASSESNVGIIENNSQQYYFKIDHEQAFMFGGEGWRANFIINQDFQQNITKYVERWRFDNILSNELLHQAIQQIIKIPLEDFEKVCDLCEQRLEKYPKIKDAKIHKHSETLFYGLSGATTIKDAVLARVKFFQDHAKDFKV